MQIYPGHYSILDGRKFQMQWIHVTDSEWEALKHYLCHKKNLSGAFVISGPSEHLAVQISPMFEEVLQAGYHPYYFLCSGSESFRVPCYLPTSDRRDIPDVLAPRHVLDGTGFRFPTQPFCSPHQTLNGLKKVVADRQGIPQLIILECITTPEASEQAFIKLLLRSTLLKYIPLIIFIHQESETDSEASSFVNVMPEEIPYVLYAVYMCGGRIEKTELARLIREKHIDSNYIEHYVTPRRTQEETWFSYRNKRTAKHIEKQFHALSMEEKQKLAKSILPLLPPGIIYPLIAIAPYISDTKLILSKYSLSTIRSALFSAPRDLLPYFRKLRAQARREQDSDLFLCATVNYIATLMFVNERNIVRIYNILRTCHDYDEHIAMILFDLFFALGQGLSRKKDPQLLICASDCYQQCHALISKVLHMYHRLKQILFAALNNGEALVALRQGDYEKALQLEGAALLALADIEDDLQVDIQRALLKTHIGDLLMRSPHKVYMAIAQYEEAYAIATSRASLETKLYIGPRLVQAHTKTQHHQNMIHLLKDLLSAWNQSQEYRAETRATVSLNITLPLAQAYITMKQIHNAALCYLHILLEPEQISPAVLKGIASNLKHCLPGENFSLWVWIENIVSEQEKRFVDATDLYNFLSSL